MHYGPTLPISQETHSTKYRSENETFEESQTRIAAALKDSDEHFRKFRDILLSQRFMPGGRIQAAMGAPRTVTPYNCFVAPTISDSFVEDESSIMEVARMAAATMRQGGGIGYDFSTLRPKGDLIKKLQSKSSGPISFMSIFDAVCDTVASSGHRRGAQMGVMRIDHPDIEEYIRAKQPQRDVQALWDLVDDAPADQQWSLKQALQKTLRLTKFNLSVAVTDKFMECLASGEPFPLTFNGEVYKTIDAASLWEQIMRSTWDWAEPGVLFIDRINAMNNLWYCEKIAATNPCGEQPLPPNGACLLGSFNLVKYLTVRNGMYLFDYQALSRDIPHIVRAMDNVVDRAKYPLEAQKVEAQSKRRMGLGVTGVANAIEAIFGGAHYGTEDYIGLQDSILDYIKNEVYAASVELAREKGAFKLYDPKYLESKFIQTLPAGIQSAISAHGIRNSHLLSIAPTGTISLSADNISSGIEPVFSYGYDRTIQMFDGPKVEHVSDYGVRVLNVKGRQADDITPAEHVDVLVNATSHVDSAVSKTCNVGDDVSWSEFKGIYQRAYDGGAKGCTTFRAAGKRTGILIAKKPKKDDSDGQGQEQEGLTCRIDPATGRRECD